MKAARKAVASKEEGSSAKTKRRYQALLREEWRAADQTVEN